jgi:hypothetical protein
LFRPQFPVPLFQPLLRRGPVYIPVDALEHNVGWFIASGVAGERGRKVGSREVDGIRLGARPGSPLRESLAIPGKIFGV